MATQAADLPPNDERLLRENRLKKLLRRPELGALGGAILVWIFFAIVGKPGFLSLSGTANYLQVSAEQGILAVAVSLLMIGGEFDLSVGSMIGGAGMIIAILSVQFGWNIWAAIAVSLVVALAIGALNGLLVVRTKLPSFIITLATLFIIRGATIGMTRLITGRTQVGVSKSSPVSIAPFRCSRGQSTSTILLRHAAFRRRFRSRLSGGS